MVEYDINYFYRVISKSHFTFVVKLQGNITKMRKPAAVLPRPIFLHCNHVYKLDSRSSNERLVSPEQLLESANLAWQGVGKSTDASNCTHWREEEEEENNASTSDQTITPRTYQ